MENFITQLIMFLIIPLWLLAGLCDWWCHRITNIETTSSTAESLSHSVMLLEMGIPILAALFFEINALIIALAIVMWLIHDATALWDVNYAHRRRYLSPLEQHVHSFLELIPLFMLLLICILHSKQTIALIGWVTGIDNISANEQADFSLRWKQQPLPPTYIISLLAAVLLLQILPYGEELLRCYRARKKIS